MFFFRVFTSPFELVWIMSSVGSAVAFSHIPLTPWVIFILLWKEVSGKLEHVAIPINFEEQPKHCSYCFCSHQFTKMKKKNASCCIFNNQCFLLSSRLEALAEGASCAGEKASSKRELVSCIVHNILNKHFHAYRIRLISSSPFFSSEREFLIYSQTTVTQHTGCVTKLSLCFSFSGHSGDRAFRKKWCQSLNTFPLKSEVPQLVSSVNL